MAKCWEQRCNDEEHMSRCPHNLANDLCPAECWNADCFRPTHVVSTDYDLLLNPDLDFDSAVRECCHFCEFFLKNGPKKSELSDEVREDAMHNHVASRFLI